MGRHDEALAGYDRILQLRPGFAPILYSRSNVLQELNRFDEALAGYDRVLAQNPADPAARNNRGNVLMKIRRYPEALADFDAVLAMLPGELDPKLALAATAELRGAHTDATRYYEVAWRTNHTFYSAAFGLARERARAGDRAGAIATLDQINAASAHFTAAGIAAVEILLDGRTADDIDEPALLDAGKRASSLTIESVAKREKLRLNVLSAALGWLEAGNTPKAARLLGCDFDEDGIRTGMEQCYRALAHETTGVWGRIDLVEKANAVRPRTRL